VKLRRLASKVWRNVAGSLRMWLSSGLRSSSARICGLLSNIPRIISGLFVIWSGS
jgi:hypothetical protein